MSRLQDLFDRIAAGDDISDLQWNLGDMGKEPAPPPPVLTPAPVISAPTAPTVAPVVPTGTPPQTVAPSPTPAPATLQGIPKEGFSQADVENVTELLNSGQISVNDVASYFEVPKSYVIENLTGVAPSAYNSGNYSDRDVDSLTNLIDKGVMSTSEVAEYFDAPDEVVEGYLTDTVGYTSEQLDRARSGQPVNAPARTPLPSIATTQYSTGAEIPTGLRGSEMALRGGTLGAIEILDQLNRAGRTDLADRYALGLEQAATQADVARGDITSGTAQGLEALGQGIGQARQDTRRAYRRARGDITSGTAQGLEALGAGIGQARQDISGAYGRAEGMFSPYQQAGDVALQQQLALSGALGQEAFNEAYQESPQIAFLREQGMRANLAGAAATGGLGGGNVQRELQRFGQGLASQGLQQQIANLGALSSQGLGATGSAANIATGAGTNLANLASAEGQARLGALTTQGSNLANIATSEGTNLANLSSAEGQARLGALTTQGSNLANIASALGGQQLGAQTELGRQLAGYNLSTGLPAAQAIGTLGTNLAAGRTRAGELLAQQYGQTAGQLGNIYGQQGRDITSMIDAQRQAIMNMVQSGAMTEAQAQEALSTNLANLQSGVGSQLAGVPNAPIFSPDYGNQIGQAFQAAGVGAYLSGNRTPDPGGEGVPVVQSVPAYSRPIVNMSALPGAVTPNYGFNINISDL